MQTIYVIIQLGICLSLKGVFMKNKKGTLSILLYLLVNTPFYDHLYLFPTKLTVCLDNNLNRHFED